MYQEDVKNIKSHICMLSTLSSNCTGRVGNKLATDDFSPYFSLIFRYDLSAGLNSAVLTQPPEPARTRSARKERRPSPGAWASSRSWRSSVSGGQSKAREDFGPAGSLALSDLRSEARFTINSPRPVWRHCGLGWAVQGWRGLRPSGPPARGQDLQTLPRSM